MYLYAMLYTLAYVLSFIEHPKNLKSTNKSKILIF